MVPVALLKRTLAYSPCANCHKQGHAGCKTLLEQNPLVLNWKCQLMQVILYNGRKMVVVVVVVVVVVGCVYLSPSTVSVCS